MPLVNVDVGSIATGLGSLAKDLRAAITGKEPINAEKAAELALKATEAENSLILAQAEINKIEAASNDKFKSYWRPGAGWTCVLGLFAMFILRPIAQWIVLLTGSDVVLPSIDVESLMGLLIPLLGLGAYRTYERAKGVGK